MSGSNAIAFERRLPIPSFTTALLWTLAGSMVAATSQWAVLILFAKLGNPAMVGEYAFAWAIAYPVSLVANLNLRALYVSDCEGRYRFSEMLGARYILVSFALFLLGVLCVALHLGLHQATVLLLISGALLIDSLSESYYAILQKHERMDRLARSMILRSCLSLAAASVTLYFTRNLLFSILGLFLGRLVTLLVFDSASETFRIGWVHAEGREQLPEPGRYARHFLPRWSRKAQADMLSVAFPLGVVAILIPLNGNIPRYVIERYQGVREVGLYSAINYVPQAALLFATTLASVAFARLSRSFARCDIRGFRSLLRRLMAFCAGLGLVALLVSMVAGRQILTFLYRPEYAERSDVLVWLVATGAIACVSTCLGYGMMAALVFRMQVPLFLVVATVSAVVSLWLVPRWGLGGAAVSSLASVIVQIIGSYFLLHRALGKRLEEKGRPFALSPEPTLVSEG